MSDHVLGGRQRALEEAFFSQQEDALLRRVREADKQKSHRQAIADALNIKDEALLDRLVALDLGPQSAAAIALVPLVLVAWADGMLDPAEKAAVQRAAREAGLDSQPEALALLDHWLATPPTPKLTEAWRGYVRAIAAELPVESRQTLTRNTLARARAVAEAAGGFLGLGSRISDAETRILKDLEAAIAG